MAAGGSGHRGHPTRARLDARQHVGTPEKVAFLRAPAAYPGAPEEVRVEETHMSWVFLAGDRAYKLKKPVEYPFLDFSTLAAREADCRAGGRLNRRLAPDVYLGVVPLTAGDDGALALQGEGRVVDWLVTMRRLPGDRMLDAAIVSGAVTRRQIEDVADLLARFYGQADAADMTARDYVAHFAR